MVYTWRLGFATAPFSVAVRRPMMATATTAFEVKRMMNDVIIVIKQRGIY